MRPGDNEACLFSPCRVLRCARPREGRDFLQAAPASICSPAGASASPGKVHFTLFMEPPSMGPLLSVLALPASQAHPHDQGGRSVGAPKHLLHSVVPARDRGAEGFRGLTSLTLSSTPHAAAPWLKPYLPQPLPHGQLSSCKRSPTRFLQPHRHQVVFLWLSSFPIQPTPHGPALLVKPRKISQAEPWSPQWSYCSLWLLYKWLSRGQSFGNDCLQTSLVVTSGGGGCSWHLVGRRQGSH